MEERNVVKNENAAIELANDSFCGRGECDYSKDIGSKDIERGRRIAKQIETGMVFIHQPTHSQSERPIGGIMNTGYGRESSQFGILEFVNKKLIHLGPKGTK